MMRRAPAMRRAAAARNSTVRTPRVTFAHRYSTGAPDSSSQDAREDLLAWLVALSALSAVKAATAQASAAKESAQ